MQITSTLKPSPLRALRGAKGLRETAREARIDPAHLSRVERGLARPSVSTVVRLAFALDIEPGEVLRALPAEAVFPELAEGI